MEWDGDRIHDGPGVGTADSASARTRQARAGPGAVRAEFQGDRSRCGPNLRGPGPACAMRAQRDAVRLTSRRASPARQNPAVLDSREPTWRNASPGDITKTTPPGVGGLADGVPGPGPHPAPPGSGTQADGAPTDSTIESGPAPPSPVRKAHRISGEDAERLGDRRENAERLQQRVLSRGRNNLILPTPRRLLPALIEPDSGTQVPETQAAS